jgi:uncharacterized protein (DUF433 family)
MSIAAEYGHVQVDRRGVARVAGTRYKVGHLAAEHYHYGWSAEELLRQHPDLEPAEVYGALAYFYDHRAELIQEMGAVPGEDARDAAAGRFPSRAELLARGPAGNR